MPRPIERATRPSPSWRLRDRSAPAVALRGMRTRHPLLTQLVDYAERTMGPVPALAVAVHISECRYCRLAVLRIQEALAPDD